MNTPLPGQFDMEPMPYSFPDAKPIQLIAGGLFLLIVALFAECIALGNETVHQKQNLSRRVSVTWQRQELGTALKRLSDTGSVSLWIDRRVDQQQEISIAIADLSLREALDEVSRQTALGCEHLADITYIGPQQSAGEASILIDQARGQIRRAPAASRKAWLRESAAQWPRLTKPRALVESWLGDAGIQAIGAEQIAHDLWPEQTLPPMPLVDRLVLLLAGFDLTCAISPDGERCEIVPIARPLRQSTPRTVPKPAPRRKPATSADQRFTLKLENQPLGNVLDHFAQQLDLEFEWHVATKSESRAQLVSCEVEDADLDVLLRNVLAPADLRHSRAGKRVTIEAMR